jgi:subtilase family serine protease
MRKVFRFLLFAVVAPTGTALAVAASSPAGISADKIVLRNSVHPLARPEFDAGPVEPDFPMGAVTLNLRPRPGSERELENLLSEQQNPNSPNFHRWLTPQQYGERFGASAVEVRSVADWLQGNGLVIDEVARSRSWLRFSGTARQVGQAFGTEIRRFVVNGESHVANATEISIPRRLAHLVRGPVSLHDFRLRPLSRTSRPQEGGASGGHDLAPADFWTIYNEHPLLEAGLDGSGVTIAVPGRTDVDISDVTAFRSLFGLPSNDPAIVHNGTDPGNLGGDEETEADLDVQWAGAAAPMATVLLVVSPHGVTDGVLLSMEAVVDQNLADVLSLSFGMCESQMGDGEAALVDNLWMQAAAQGITVIVASGDSGAALCDLPSQPSAVQGPAVNGTCSTPYDVCVGGTSLDDLSNLTAYWSDQGSAVSYVPETAWNESGENAGETGLWASGGGRSILYPKPTWQFAPGVLADGARDVPDVALNASGHTGYLVFHGSGTLGTVRGTSVAAPAFAGIMAVAVQRAGERQGNPNTRLYEFAAAQYGANGPAVFHDITVGDNSVPGQPGFTCGPGYDAVTGLGSVDAAALVNSWPVSNTPTLTGGCNGFPCVRPVEPPPLKPVAIPFPR